MFEELERIDDNFLMKVSVCMVLIMAISPQLKRNSTAQIMHRGVYSSKIDGFRK